jgi:hypothetical protein
LTNKTVLLKNLSLNIPMGVCKDRGQKSRKPRQTDLIEKARRVVNATRELVAKRREVDERLRSWCPEDLVDFWKGD